MTGIYEAPRLFRYEMRTVYEAGQHTDPSQSVKYVGLNTNVTTISGITWLVGDDDFLCNEKQKKHSQISSNIFFPSKELIHRKIICFCLLLLVLLIKLEKFSIFGYWLPRVAAGYRSNNSNL